MTRTDGSAGTGNSILWTALAVIAADQVTKAWAVSALADGPIDVVWKLRFNLVWNTGFAFSTGSGLGPVLGVAAIVITVVLWRARDRVGGALGSLGVGLVMGGALGNLIDRALRGDAWLRGAVVDFIDLQFWPVFNIADMAIVCGVGALIVGLRPQLDDTDRRG